MELSPLLARLLNSSHRVEELSSLNQPLVDSCYGSEEDGGDNVPTRPLLGKAQLPSLPDRGERHRPVPPISTRMSLELPGAIVTPKTAPSATTAYGEHDNCDVASQPADPFHVSNASKLSARPSGPLPSAAARCPVSARAIGECSDGIATVLREINPSPSTSAGQGHGASRPTDGRAFPPTLFGLPRVLSSSGEGENEEEVKRRSSWQSSQQGGSSGRPSSAGGSDADAVKAQCEEAHRRLMMDRERCIRLSRTAGGRLEQERSSARALAAKLMQRPT